MKIFAFCTALLAMILFANAQVTNPSIVSSSSSHKPKHNDISIISSIKSSLRDNSLRAGFEPFYFITNLFIDELFVQSKSQNGKDFNIETLKNRFNSVQAIFSNVTNKNINSYWKELIIRPFQVYPSLSGLILATILLIVVIPLIGLFVMFYRCCCRSKFNPFDRKLDSVSRKINAVFMFILLLVILFGTIILFFTNQNSSIAVRKIPHIYDSHISQINHLLSKDIPEFVDQSSNRDFFQRNASEIYEKTIMLSINATISNISSSVSSIKTIRKISNELNELNSSYSQLLDIDNAVIQKLNATGFASLIVELKSVYQKMKKLDMKELDFDKLIANLIKDLTENSKKDFIEKIDIAIKEAQKKFKEQLKTADFSQIQENFNDTSTGLRTHVKLVPQYYEYFYYVIMGVSGAMIFLFIIYSFGLAGMCARRTHHNYKQACHRGVSANFLLTGVGFYFLFSWIFLIVCILLYVPGIILRQNVCSPLINLDNTDILIRVNLRADFLNDTSINFTRLINECHKTNHSVEIDNVLLKVISQFVSRKTNLDGELTNMLAKIKIPQFQQKVDDFAKTFQGVFSDDLHNSLNDFKQTVATLKTEFEIKDNSTVEQINKLLNLTELSLKFYENKRLINDLKQENMMFNLLNETIKTFVLNEINSILIESTKSFVKQAPPCNIISDTYRSLVTTGCYEILDNLNTYWFTLIILVLIHLILLGFALNQADLFRKFYAYDELLSDDMNSESKHAMFPHDQYEIFQTRNSNPTAPIDAYEMNGYSKNNHLNNGILLKSQNKTPPEYRNVKYN